MLSVLTHFMFCFYCHFEQNNCILPSLALSRLSTVTMYCQQINYVEFEHKQKSYGKYGNFTVSIKQKRALSIIQPINLRLFSSERGGLDRHSVCPHVLLPTDLCVAGHDFRQSVIRHAVSYAGFRWPEHENTVDLRFADATCRRHSCKIAHLFIHFKFKHCHFSFLPCFVSCSYSSRRLLLSFGAHFLANVNRVAICRRPSVCRLSVTFVRPTQAVGIIFGNVSISHLVPWPSNDIQVKFYGDRPRRTTPSGG